MFRVTMFVRYATPLFRIKDTPKLYVSPQSAMSALRRTERQLVKNPVRGAI